MHDIAHMVAVTAVEYKSKLEHTKRHPQKDTPYLALTGELWGVICEDFGEKWPRYNGSALYWAINQMV